MSHRFGIVYQSTSLLAIDKPAGVLSVPDRHDRERISVAGSLLSKFPDARPLHRLDAETSGVLLFCLQPDAFGWYSDQFEIRTVQKVYVTLVEGKVLQDDGIIDAPIFTRQDGHGIVSKNGKTCRTAWRVMERFKWHTLLQATPHTGRTHQIRVHLAHIGHPVVGDTQYGAPGPLLLSALKGKGKFKLSLADESERPLLSRMALHAESISIREYDTGKMLTIRSEWPKDLTVALKKLRQWTPVI